MNSLPPSPDRDKKLQILEGARSVFLAKGFDGASMGEIAREAGVSKGTLYVYFESKQLLFAELVSSEKRQSAEQLFELDAEDHDVARVLGKLGNSYLELMLRPDHVASLRAVIGVAEKFPEVGQALYDAGPRIGIQRLSGYLARQVEAGILAIEDIELAATQFLGMLMNCGVTPTMLASAPPPGKERRKAIIDGAVAVFLAAYGAG
ncbi:transcriptional regulator [Agaricicola taiwanensis]|uniref:Transcriptional regulator n=1 Tax=Agaricicola taiwanensis TaxID=591372 RepID=A0A8J2VQZ0_9RHOB|nr:TetR/AcrR family transcriptional regulator [Agaricicola taiwanensis]GGE33872.1 transcriptional regulator [Agaricicola taiwanensis]